MMTLTEADADKTVEVAAGDTVEIQLPENVTTGYRWTLKTIDRSICNVVAEERHGPDKIIPGAPGTHVWQLKAARTGDCQIEITYARAWQSGTAPAQTFKVCLRVRT